MICDNDIEKILNQPIVQYHRNRYEKLKQYPRAVRCVKLPQEDPKNDYYDAKMYTVGQIYPLYVDCDDIVFVPQETDDRNGFEVKFGVALDEQEECFETIW